MTIGEKLRLFGKQHFSNTTEFAKALSMTQPSLSLYINGHREPGTGILRRLQALGCDLNWLLRDEDQQENIAAEPTVYYVTQQQLALEKEVKELRAQLATLKKIINK